jgi:cytoskeletal protein RodZ
MATALTCPPPTSPLPDLAAIREAKGISLSQIADATKIAPYYLDAIERSRFDRLPGGVFNTSYIRQYARAIEYSERDLLACYQAQSETPEPERKRGGLLRLCPDAVLRFLSYERSE